MSNGHLMAVCRNLQSCNVLVKTAKLNEKSPSLKKTWLAPSFSEGGRLVALMQKESIQLKVILSDSIKKTWLAPSLSEDGRLVALMQKESIQLKVILSDSMKKGSSL